MKIAMSIEGIFFLTRFAFHHSGVGGSCIFFLSQNMPSAQYNVVNLSPKAIWAFFSERKNEEVALKKKVIITFPAFSALVKLLLEGSVYNKCLVSGILQFHRP